jgi:hypothetical protein
VYDPCGGRLNHRLLCTFVIVQRLIMYFSYDRFIYKVKRRAGIKNRKSNYFSYIRNGVLKKGICLLQIKNAVHIGIMKI